MITRRECLLAAGLAARDGPKLVETKGEKVAVEFQGVRLLEYRYSADRPKPYVHPLCLADGRALTLDSPKDHVHHRGLMVAWSEVNGIDFWGEVNPGRHGRIVHRRFEKLRANGAAAEMVEIDDWVAEGRTLLTERRTLRVTAPAPTGEGVWLEWTTELRAAGTRVLLAAGQHVYDGLGIRFIPAMDGGGVLNSAGSRTIEQANGQPAAWCCYTGAGATVAMFDHPSNPRHPNAFFVMNKPFGYLSAAPTFRAPFELGPGESIRFRWGVLARAGEPAADAMEGRFQQWRRQP